MPALLSASALLIALLAFALAQFWVRRWRRAATASRSERDELQRQVELFRSLVEYADDVVLVVSAESVLLYAGGGVQRALGRPAREAVGRPLMEAAAGDEGRKLAALVADSVSGLSQSMDLHVQRGESGHRAAYEAVTENRLADPLVGGIVVRLRDITKRKWAEEAVRAAETKYRTLVEQLPLVTYLDNLDEYSSALYMSPQVEELLGYRPEEWLADPALFPKLLHPDDRDRVMAEVARAHENGDRFVSEYRLVARDGRVVWFHDEAVTIRDETGQPLYSQGYLLDITAQKEAAANRAARPA